MDDVVFMNMMQAVQDHEHNVAHELRWEQALFIFRRVCVHDFFLILDHLMKLLCIFKILHHNVQFLLVLVLLDILDNVWMVEHRRNSDFVIYESQNS